MSFTTKLWKNKPDTSTPINDVALNDLESRISAGIQSVVVTAGTTAGTFAAGNDSRILSPVDSTARNAASTAQSTANAAKSVTDSMVAVGVRLPAVVGVPSSGLGLDNDEVSDKTTGIVYVRSGGAWVQDISTPTLDPKGALKQAVAKPYLTVSGANVYEGAPTGNCLYRATGYGVYTAFADQAPSGNVTTPAQWAKQMADMRPNSLHRVFCLSPNTALTGMTWGTKLAALSVVVASAKAHNQRLNLCLSAYAGVATNEQYGNKTSAWFTAPQYTAAGYNQTGVTLGAAAGVSDTTLTTSVALTHTGRHKIDSEILYVTAISGTTATVLRGQDGTTAATHANGASVISAGSYQEWVQAVITLIAGESTVSIVDLMSEPADSGSNTAAVVAFVNAASGWVKAIEPRLLVHMGVISYSNVGGHAAMQAIFGASGIDLVSMHDYSDMFSVNYGQNSPLADNLSGKPFYLDETGVVTKSTYDNVGDTDDPGFYPGRIAVPHDVQGALIKHIVETAFSSGAFAVNVWSLVDNNNTGLTGAAGYEPPNGSPAKIALRNVPFEGDGLSNRKVASINGWLDLWSTSLNFRPATQLTFVNSGEAALYRFKDRGTGTGPTQNYQYTQATAANAPFSAQKELIGVPPGIRFAGSQWIPANQQSCGGTAHSTYLALTPTAFPASGAFAYIIAPATSTDSFALRVNNAGQVQIVAYSSATVIATSTTSLRLNQVNIVEADWDATNGLYRLIVNGVGPGGIAGVTAATKTLASNTSLIGCDVSGTAGFVGYLHEVLRYSAFVGGNDRTTISSYLARRWGM